MFGGMFGVDAGNFNSYAGTAEAQDIEREVEADPGLNEARADIARGIAKATPLGVFGDLGNARNAAREGQYAKATGYEVLAAIGVMPGTRIVTGTAFKSFKALKNALGFPGVGKVWHHIVEQCQSKCTRSSFTSQVINNTKNVAAVPRAVNQRLADMYASKQFAFTKGKTLRDWLSGKSFKEQYEYGKRFLKEEMDKYEKDPNNYP